MTYFFFDPVQVREVHVAGQSCAGRGGDVPEVHAGRSVGDGEPGAKYYLIYLRHILHS